MTVSEFESYLEKGLGRAIILLRQEPDKTPFREAVWNHAMHDPRYDRQCNAPRGHYIKELFDCFPDGDALLSELFRIYGEDRSEPEDRCYYIETLFELAEEHTAGASAALDSLYSILLEALLNSPNPLTDGRDRERDDYLLAAERRYCLNHTVLGELVRDGIILLQRSSRYDIVDFTVLFDYYIIVSKIEGFSAILAAIEIDNPVYKAYLDDYRKESEKRYLPIEDSLVMPTNWREAIDYIATMHGKSRPLFEETLWQNLSEDDRAEIARLAEEEPDLSRRCVVLCQLRHFGDEVLRCYPRDPSPLIAELETNVHVLFPIGADNGKRLLWEISRLVAKIRHPAVREFALRSLPHYTGTCNSISYLHVIEAWMTNYAPEDADTLASFVTSVSDKDILHGIGMDLLNSRQQIPESVLLYLYENNPCSSCRNRIFMSLMERYGEMTKLPEPLAHIREEAKLDCDYGTRMVARAQSIRKENRK